MFATPGSTTELAQKLSRDATTRIAKSWWVLCSTASP